jgi:hypothetical protein
MSELYLSIPGIPLHYVPSSVCSARPHTSAPMPDYLSLKTSYLSQQLPEHIGTRPEVRGVIPHRQVTQKGSSTDFALLSRAIQSLVSTHLSCLKLDTLCFEKHSIVLFSTNPINRTCSSEVCHAHPSDGSLHLRLTSHLVDVHIVLKRGWGQRHLLARGGWC